MAGRFVVVQSGLKNRTDHFYNETLGWRRAVSARGIEMRLLAHRDAEPDVAAELGARAVCPYQPFVKLPSDPATRELESFIKIAARLGAALYEHVADLDADDLVAVPFATEREIYGVAQSLARLPRERRPRAVFLFHHPDHTWTLNSSGEVVSGDIAYCRYAAREMARVLPLNRTLYGATNRALAVVMAKAMDVPFAPLPFPVDVPDGDCALPTVHIGVLGNMREEKGGNLIAGVVNGFLAERPGRLVFLQAGDDAQAAAMRGALDVAVRGAVTVHAGGLSNDAFLERLRGLDLLLLPYLWQRYVFRISALFSEAAAAGVPAVVPVYTWMARRIAAGEAAGVTFAESRTEPIVEALVKASDSADALKAAARERRDSWRRKYSAEALIGALCQWQRPG